MTENPLGYEKISKLLKDFAIPSIMASLVGSIYNIVDQIFIGQGVGYLGNAATNVAYPFSTICLAIALLVGIGSASRVSLCLGRKEPKAAAKAAGNGIVLMGIFGIIYLLVGETFLSLLLKAFGATTDVFPYAKQYASITLIGMPFLIVTNGMSNLIRADGKPKYSMVCMVMGAIINTIFDPIFIFACDWGIAGAAWATVIGQIFSFILALRYLWRFQTIHFEKESFLLDIKESMKICSMGISSSSNQIAVTVIQIIQYNSLTYYGALTKYGTDIPLAACGIVMKTNAIILAIVVGISQGTQPIIGFNYGAIIAREVSAVKAAVVTIGYFHGGVAYNAIPSEVEIEGTIRALEEPIRQYLAKRIEEIAKSTAATFRGTAEVEMDWGAPPVINNDEMAALVTEAAKEVVGEEDVVSKVPAPNMAGEDFAYYLQKVPGAFFFLSSSNPVKHTDVPHHNPHFNVDEDVLYKGSAMFVKIVEAYLK